MRSGKTGSDVARKASSILKDGRSRSTSKSSAGSALSQSRTSKTTSTQEARTAAKVLASPTSGKSAKSMAASVLSQKKSPFPVKTYRVAGSSLTQKESAAIVRKVAKKSK
jgi:hypothetical protein